MDEGQVAFVGREAREADPSRGPEDGALHGSRLVPQLEHALRAHVAHHRQPAPPPGPVRPAGSLQEAPGLPADEFIDNIPFPETQTYVKRIIGTTEDYRRLYGSGLLDPNGRLTARR